MKMLFGNVWTSLNRCHARRTFFTAFHCKYISKEIPFCCYLKFLGLFNIGIRTEHMAHKQFSNLKTALRRHKSSGAPLKKNEAFQGGETGFRYWSSTYVNVEGGFCWGVKLFGRCVNCDTDFWSAPTGGYFFNALPELSVSKPDFESDSLETLVVTIFLIEGHFHTALERGCLHLRTYHSHWNLFVKVAPHAWKCCCGGNFSAHGSDGNSVGLSHWLDVSSLTKTWFASASTPCFQRL